jgi:hypothetical protein
MENLRDGAAVAWANIMTFAPKFLMFIIVIVAGYFLAKFLARMFDALLERLKFDNLVERGGVKRVLSKTGYDASDVLAKLLFYALFLFVLQFAFGIFGPNPISDLLTRIIAYIPNIFVAAIIIIVASAIAKGVKEILAVSLGGLSYGQVLSKIAGAAIVILGVFAALDQLAIAPNIVRGIFYAGLAVIAGSAIIAIGGGGIQPMRQRWERALGRIEAESPRLKQQAGQTGVVAEQKTEEWKQRAQDWVNQPEQRNEPVEFRPHE